MQSFVHRSSTKFDGHKSHALLEPPNNTGLTVSDPLRSAMHDHGSNYGEAQGLEDWLTSHRLVLCQSLEYEGRMSSGLPGLVACRKTCQPRARYFSLMQDQSLLKRDRTSQEM